MWLHSRYFDVMGYKKSCALQCIKPNENITNTEMHCVVSIIRLHWTPVKIINSSWRDQNGLYTLLCEVTDPRWFLPDEINVVVFFNVYVFI